MEQRQTRYMFLLILIPVITCLSEPVTLLPTKILFQNTLNRWSVKTTSDADRKERWTRFQKYKATVDDQTTGVVLDSLNRFTVMNDVEFKEKTASLLNQFNVSEVLGDSRGEDSFHLSHRDRRDIVDLPATYDYWEKSVGLHPAGEQLSCGSCWSFPNVATMEVLYKKLTGEFAKFSEQYFVDCSFPYSGCEGGDTKVGLRLTRMRQYLVYEEDWPYTANYEPCKLTDEINSFTNNAMNKAWFQDYMPLSNTEEGFLGGLQHSPVSFGAYISNDFFGYSGGIWRDSGCVSTPLAHAMLLVGYTEQYIRVRNSFGVGWGEDGYVNLARDNTISYCRYFENSFAAFMTHRRELEYKLCNNNQLSTYTQCKESCQAMNTDAETGWTLAVIPTLYHNQQIVEMVNELYPGVKQYDKFNYLWIGITDSEKDLQFAWEDRVTPVNYMNITGKLDEPAKWGLVNKNSGSWIFKNSETFQARGICSRARTCWDIEDAVEHGHVTFDRTELTEGALGSVMCDTGYTLSGISSVMCVGGTWTPQLPTCIHEREAVCPGGSYHTGIRCEECPENHWISPGDTSSSGQSGCNRCSDGLISKAGSDEARDCHEKPSYECKPIQRSDTGKYRFSCKCIACKP